MRDNQSHLSDPQVQLVLKMLDVEAQYRALMHRIGAKRIISHGLVF